MLKGHQMSGLCFRKNNRLIPCYDRNAQKNPYAEIYFLAYNMLRGDSIHIMELPLRNTVISKKNWDYSADNLLKNVYGLGLTSEQESSLLDNLFRKEFACRVWHLRNYVHPFRGLKRIEGHDLNRKNKNKAKHISISRSVHVPYMLASRLYHTLGG